MRDSDRGPDNSCHGVVCRGSTCLIYRSELGLAARPFTSWRHRRPVSSPRIGTGDVRVSDAYGHCCKPLGKPSFTANRPPVVVRASQQIYVPQSVPRKMKAPLTIIRTITSLRQNLKPVGYFQSGIASIGRGSL